MKAAALLALLAALPAHAGGPVSPEQARTNVVKAMGLPADVERGAKAGDLQRFLSGLPQPQKEAALRALQAKSGELGDDPSTLAFVGQAYAGLGKVKEARQAALQIQREHPNDPEASRLMQWVNAQEKLPGREGSASPEASPSGSRVAPAAAGGRPMNPLEAKLQSLFRRGGNSPEFTSTMSDAGGKSVNQLKGERISFSPAAADQKDAVLVTEHPDGTVTVALRDDALNSGGDREARAAAHFANGVRQAQILRDNNAVVGWVLVKARGWYTGAQTHKELAPNDIDRNPKTPSDQNLMAARRIVDRKAAQIVPGQESYGSELEDDSLNEVNSLPEGVDVDTLFQRFIKLTRRGFGP
ncbi:MAG: hypothetical protein FD126_1768 [Elusimicrobia bacterium]|nr:MAG: hypothetical protein FD126_1768 [Elusimicrobiota bacterium]